ncbi:MAG: hypothetical protein HWQ35_07760 [Nostoc sp. NMS1]|uniref:hypothetical protein n=1 Tax=unclassified Nostoc TaxID=2593658 RepID=UPI0025F34855|nr:MULTISPECIES: hypothetical protein [unclassified Nostoc]MBN3906444.1 hypothetical protein [Nostoc sp. NMS1]MBN3994862.1 hypothetical protein [Nostoc sp. NMS2]
MSKITISDLHSDDSEGLLIDISNLDYISIYAGADDALAQILNYGVKNLHFALLAFTIHEVAELAESFNT